MSAIPVIPAAKNQTNDIKIRKFKDTMVTGGFAIIAFGIWTVIKCIIEAFTVLQPLLGSLTFETFTEEQAAQIKAMIEDNSLFYSLLLMVLVYLAVDLALRLYVGLSAHAIGLEKKKKNGKERNGILWLIFGVILVAFSVYSLIVTFQSTADILQMHSIMYYLISLLADVTSIYVTVEVVVSGFRLRWLTKKQKENEEVRDAA
jgi:hypothetical protein